MTDRERTKISWADYTFNSWTGCTKVSPGCDHCYAEGWSKRSGHVQWGPHGERRRTSPANWRLPLKWDREAERDGKRVRVFCASLADVFDNHPSILPEWRFDLWDLISRTPHLDWLLLTKRPQNIARFLPPNWQKPWPNVWLGTTVENQTEADRRIPHLLAVPAAKRFLSCEPLLGPVDLSCYTWGRAVACEECPQDIDCSCSFLARGDLDNEPALDWVICGGESGYGARPMHPDWARSLRDQCQAAGVAFHFKQWGEWAPAMHDPAYEGQVLRQTEKVGDFDTWNAPVYDPSRSEGINWRRLGKKRAGRLLDGREWNEVPG